MYILICIYVYIYQSKTIFHSNNTFHQIWSYFDQKKRKKKIRSRRSWSILQVLIADSDHLIFSFFFFFYIIPSINLTWWWSRSRSIYSIETFFPLLLSGRSLLSTQIIAFRTRNTMFRHERPVTQEIHYKG